MREAIGEKGERMLELLAQGSSNREVAVRMGYQEGTMRVYLHNLYRKIGVGNKTEAVIWYLKRQDNVVNAASQAASAQPAAPAQPESQDLFGDMALREDLFTAMGVMSAFIGPYGRVWEVGQRLKGVEMDDAMRARRERVRSLWRALLKGDWAHGRRIHDEDNGYALAQDAPADAVMLASLLFAGGYTGAADRLVTKLTQRRKAGSDASPREAHLMKTVREAFEGRDAEAITRLRTIAQEKSTPAVLKHVAMALAFHAQAGRRDFAGARATANALWTESEAAKQQLIAMGERPFSAPVRAVARRPVAREKVAAR